MPTEFGDAIQSPAPTGKTEFGDAVASPEPVVRNATNPNMLGPSPDLAQIGNRVFSNIGGMLRNLPSGVMAFVRHPIETTKAVVGQMDLEHPENSSGLLGLPDVLYRNLQTGQETPQQVTGDIVTMALPGATTERAGLAGEAASEAGQSLLRKAMTSVPSNATADVVGATISPRAANMIRVANRAKRAIQAFQNAGEEAAPAAAEVVSPEIQAMRDQIAKGFKYKDYASVKDATDQATIRDLANRLNSGAAPEAAAPVNRPGPQLVLPRRFPPKNIRDIAQQELGQGNPPSGQDIIRGSSNIPLSEQGAAEAQRLAQATAGQFDKIYTSPLDRAQATAKAVAATNPQAGAPEPTEALTPWYLGGHEGQPTMKVLDKMQDLIQNKPDEVPAGRGPQSTQPGQSFNDFKSEFLTHVQKLAQDYEPGQKILNATHYRDTRVLEAWAKAGAPSDFRVDVPTMLEKGDVKPGDLLRLDPVTLKVTAVSDANQPGIYFARHGATAWNAENGTVNPAESVGAPGPANAPPAARLSPASAPPASPQPSAAEVARLNAGAPPAQTGGSSPSGGMFLRNFDLDTMARALRSGLNKGSITKSQVSQVLNGQAQLELLRDQLGLKGRIPPNAAAYLRNKVF